VFSLPRSVVATQMSLFLQGVGQCFFFLELCRVRSFTIYSLRQIDVVRSVVNVPYMQVGLIIRTACLGGRKYRRY
jgi:hypothetical protein